MQGIISIGFYHTPRSAAEPLVLDMMETSRYGLFNVILQNVRIGSSVVRKGMDGQRGYVCQSEVEMKYNWLVSYDIREPKRLRKVAKYLEGYGERLQLSVFKIYANDREIEKIKWELTKRIEKEDSILYFKFCNSCSMKIQNSNPGMNWTKEVENYRIF